MGGIAEAIPPIAGATQWVDARGLARSCSGSAAGFDLRGIRPPTVPAGTARLRVSLTLNATPDDVRRLASTLEEMWPGL